MKISVEDGQAVAKKMLYLAWRASQCLGMGRLQNNPSADEEGVWACCVQARDYQGSKHKTCGDGKVSADYVFGRMMKLNFEYGEDHVTIRDGDLLPDYQSWCGTYPTYKALVDAATSPDSEPEPVNETPADPMREMAIMQGYVTAKCTLPGFVVMAETMRGVSACDGCNMDRANCGGKSKPKAKSFDW